MSNASEFGRLRIPSGAQLGISHGVAQVVRLRPLGEACVPCTSVVQCSGCSLRCQCLPAELQGDALNRVDGRLATVRRKVRQGEVLFRAGDKFEALFVAWTGFFKTVAATRQGRDQVAGFLMPGDLIGVEGIDAGSHAVEAIALRDSQVCVIRYADLQALARDAPSLERRLLQLMSRKVVNDQRTMLYLGSMRADERIAAFLLDWGAGLEARGYSGSLLVLPMGRTDLGSYLGLTPESVSRVLSNFRSAGLLNVCLRQVRIMDVGELRRVVDGA